MLALLDPVEARDANEVCARHSFRCIRAPL
jgi:hypothetical protein